MNILTEGVAAPLPVAGTISPVPKSNGAITAAAANHEKAKAFTALVHKAMKSAGACMKATRHVHCTALGAKKAASLVDEKTESLARAYSKMKEHSTEIAKESLGFTEESALCSMQNDSLNESMERVKTKIAAFKKISSEVRRATKALVVARDLVKESTSFYVGATKLAVKAAISYVDDAKKVEEAAAAYVDAPGLMQTAAANIHRAAQDIAATVSIEQAEAIKWATTLTKDSSAHAAAIDGADIIVRAASKASEASKAFVRNAYCLERAAAKIEQAERAKLKAYGNFSACVDPTILMPTQARSKRGRAVDQTHDQGTKHQRTPHRAASSNRKGVGDRRIASARALLELGTMGPAQAGAKK